ncbi:hypothetical protein CLOHAE12215_02197 [Clostridium haemolyticum]|nr:hypothetical protein CLOHAE12215_02197 [Clostridium haemolyticum]
MILLWGLCLGVLIIKDNFHMDEIGNGIHGLKAIQLKREQVTNHAGYLSEDKLTNLF